MALFAALAWVATGVAVAGTVESLQQSRRAEKASRRQVELDRRRAEIANIRERRQALADARRQQAMVRAQSAIMGVSGGSAEMGSLSSLRSQVGERVGFSGQQELFGNLMGQQQGIAARAQTRAQTSQAVGQLPSQLGLPTVFSPGQIFGPKTDSGG